MALGIPIISRFLNLLRLVISSSIGIPKISSFSRIISRTVIWEFPLKRVSVSEFTSKDVISSHSKKNVEVM
jgi:hypothetical protein